MKVTEITTFLNALTPSFTPILDGGFSARDYMRLDLSVNNLELQGIDTASAKAIAGYIQQKLEKKAAKVAYGGYAEHRDIYDRSTHFIAIDSVSQRNIHLGIDLWCTAGTKVLAPLDATVHSFRDNRNYGDYGPCIILEHHCRDQVFYSLYGHLDRESLIGIERGMYIAKGSAFARLGETEVNGDYAPHLHFQLILDISEYEGDYPGVSSAKDLSYYLGNCPDPNLLLKI